MWYRVPPFSPISLILILGHQSLARESSSAKQQLREEWKDIESVQRSLRVKLSCMAFRSFEWSQETWVLSSRKFKARALTISGQDIRVVQGLALKEKLPVLYTSLLYSIKSSISSVATRTIWRLLALAGASRKAGFYNSIIMVSDYSNIFWPSPPLLILGQLCIDEDWSVVHLTVRQTNARPKCKQRT